MAGFMDSVIGKITEGVTNVSDNTKLFAEKSKLNTEIRGTENSKALLLQNMGTLVYNLQASGEIEIEQCKGICAEISEMDKKIFELQEKIQMLETMKAQPTPMQTTMTAIVTETAQQDGLVCECGCINRSDAKFCAKCGHQF